MAILRINFLNSNNQIINTVTVRGKKMSKTELRKMYGKDSEEVDNDYYYVREKNQFNIKWLIKSYNTRFDTFRWDMCCNSKISYYKIIVNVL